MTLVIGLHGKKKSGKTTFEEEARLYFPSKNILCIAFADALKECCKLLACKNKDCFDTQEGKDTVLETVEITLHQRVHDMVTNFITIETCRQLGLKPIDCMIKIEQAIKRLFRIKNLASCLYQEINFGGITAGRLLQLMGTDIIREIHPDIWVTIVKNKIQQNIGQKEIILVTDVRFPNEYEMLKNFSHSYVMRIQRSCSYSNIMEDREGREGRDQNHASEIAMDDLPMHTLLNDGILEDYQEKVRNFLADPCLITKLPVL